MYVADVGILSARHLDLALHKVSDLKGGGAPTSPPFAFSDYVTELTLQLKSYVTSKNLLVVRRLEQRTRC